MLISVAGRGQERLRPSLGRHGPDRVEEAVRQLRTLRFVHFFGDPASAAPAPHLDFADPRLQAVRHSPFMTLYLRRDRHARFWFREARFYALFLTLMGASRWLAGTPVPVSVRDLAARSGLSVPTVCAMLKRAETTGDFTRHTYAPDQRRQIFEPSAHCIAALRDLVRDFTAMAAAYTGTPDPLAAPHGAAPADLYRFFVEQTLDNLSLLKRLDQKVDRKAFAFLIWDLLAEGPAYMRDFVPLQACRLAVTHQTVRNVLARAAATGWLERGEPLVASAMARGVFGAMLVTMEARWALMLDVMAHIATRSGPALPRSPCRANDAAMPCVEQDDATEVIR